MPLPRLQLETLERAKLAAELSLIELTISALHHAIRLLLTVRIHLALALDRLQYWLLVALGPQPLTLLELKSPQLCIIVHH